MGINYITPKETNVSAFYADKGLTQEQIDKIHELLLKDKEIEATEKFINESLIPAIEDYEDEMRGYLEECQKGIYSKSDGNKIIRVIAYLSVGLASLLFLNYKRFSKEIYGPYIFSRAGINDVDVQSAILAESLNAFSQTIDSTMAQTQNFLTSSVRKVQKDMIVEDALLKNFGIEGDNFDKALERFKKNLKSKYPEIARAITDGNIFNMIKYGSDGEIIRRYTLPYYIDLVSQKMLLDMDRTTVKSACELNNERFAEYYQAEMRKVKEPREICIQTLANTNYGLSIVALDDDAAEITGIQSLNEIISEGGMGFMCRHSIRRLSQEILDKLNKEMKGGYGLN